ncbi:hypothetical protein [Microbacterium invictum]|uniref:Helix-turn-helix domain-containing protein n=1 Tax=Microbacterium invictum TaxID=515415 RepID=A0ABZ0VFS2_9MICO|nr:hypothetical protein [Microbacterium invictum]WQB71974.1 hypothetical protein T9R20_08525 [Microbacterium invictum]
MATMYPIKLFPYPQPGYYRRTGSPEARVKNPEQFWNHSTRVIRWMGRNALRQLRQFELHGMPFPSEDELAAWILEACDPHAQKHFDADDVAEKVTSAARWALTAYDPGFYTRAAKGGSASIQITDEQLVSVQGLSHAEAARALNVSKSTIRRRREERGQLDADQVWIDARLAEEAQKEDSAPEDDAEPTAPVEEQIERVFEELDPQSKPWWSGGGDALRAQREAEGAARLMADLDDLLEV